GALPSARIEGTKTEGEDSNQWTVDRERENKAMGQSYYMSHQTPVNYGNTTAHCTHNHSTLILCHYNTVYIHNTRDYCTLLSIQRLPITIAAGTSFLFAEACRHGRSEVSWQTNGLCLIVSVTDTLA